MSGVLLAQYAEPAFARHETFHLRFGWLRKGFAAVQHDPEVFTRPDATVTLGVGKNMVSAIKYWCQAYKVIEQSENPGRPRLPDWTPSAFGQRLLGEDGWDPWLENPASLWLLHWKLLDKKSAAPVWWAAFNLFPPEQFDEFQLTDLVVELTSAAGWRAVNESSIKKDVDCLLRTFAVRRTGRQTLDDLLDCPTRQLGLIAPASGETRSWRFVTGPKPSLPPPIVAYACLDFLAKANANASTVSLARMASDVGSPGRAFRLTESNLYDVLAGASRQIEGMEIAEPAGLRQLVVHEDVETMRDAVLDNYYCDSRVKQA